MELIHTCYRITDPERSIAKAHIPTARIGRR